MADRARAVTDAENWRLIYGKETPQATNDKYSTLALKNYNDMGQVVGETPYTWNQQTGEPLLASSGKQQQDFTRIPWHTLDHNNPALVDHLANLHNGLSSEEQPAFRAAMLNNPDLAVKVSERIKALQGQTPGQPGSLINIGQGWTQVPGNRPSSTPSPSSGTIINAPNPPAPQPAPLSRVNSDYNSGLTSTGRENLLATFGFNTTPSEPAPNPLANKTYGGNRFQRAPSPRSVTPAPVSQPSGLAYTPGTPGPQSSLGPEMRPNPNNALATLRNFETQP
jgi:hypothetical protein